MACADLDRDQTFTVHDFGPRGYVGNVTVNLTQGLQPGAMISAVLLTDHVMNIAIHDADKNAIFSFGPRLHINQLAFNSLLDGKWGTEVHAEKNPWKKGMRATLCLFYDVDGYRVFINGESVLFYKHRSNNRASYMEIVSGQVFKVIYQTSIIITP